MEMERVFSAQYSLVMKKSDEKLYKVEFETILSHFTRRLHLGYLSAKNFL